MWTERQWRERRIGVREILWSWTIVAAIALGVAAWDGVRALLPELDRPDARTSMRLDR
jgi:hypothetical protein